MKINKTKSKEHAWVTYMNPRNRKVKLVACSGCGVFKGGVSMTVGCNDTIDRVSNMFQRQGWVEFSLAA